MSNNVGTLFGSDPTSGSASGTPSYLRLDGYNGFGSTNTMINRYTTVTTNVGTDFTYADSATLGNSITINTAGIYTVTACAATATYSSVGVSVNSTQLSTQIYSINYQNILCTTTTGNTGFQGTSSFTGWFNVGDVIRGHNDGTSVFTVTNTPIWMLALAGPIL